MGYYGLGSKEGILADLKTQLDTISGIKFVDYQRIRASGIGPDKYPGIFVNDASTEQERMLKDLVRNVFGVQLVCWCWATGENTLGTQMNAFSVTIKGKIMADPYRNSNAYDTIIENISTDSGSRNPQGMIVINLAIPFYSEK